MVNILRRWLGGLRMDAGEGVSLKIWGRFRPEVRPRMTISGTKMMADIFRKFFLLYSWNSICYFTSSVNFSLSSQLCPAWSMTTPSNHCPPGLANDWGRGESGLWVLHPGLHQHMQAQSMTGSTGGRKEGLHSWPLGVSKHLPYNTHTHTHRSSPASERRSWAQALECGLESWLCHLPEKGLWGR